MGSVFLMEKEKRELQDKERKQRREQEDLARKQRREQEELLRKQRKEREKQERRERIIRSEKKILKISFWAGLFFAVAELIFALFSHSQSSLMDAVYDSTELIFIALILFLTPLFHMPISEKYPYGFYQVESIFLIIKGFMMVAVTFGVALDVVQTALSGGNMVDGNQVSLFQLVQGLGCLVVYIIMYRLNKHLNSPTVDAEVLGWKLDVWYSLGLSLAFFGSTFLVKTPLAPFAPYFDPLVAVVIMFGMLPETVRMLWSSIRDVFLVSPAESLENIKEISGGILENYDLKPVFYDVLQTGRHLWVSVYVSTEKEMLKVESFKNAQDEVKSAVKAQYDDCSCELILKP